jgi:hypothetical protein
MPETNSTKAWTDGDMDEAVALYLKPGNELSYEALCASLGSRIPPSTLKAHVKAATQGRTVRRIGRPTTLDTEHERWLASWVYFCYRLGVPPRKLRIRRKAKEIGDKAGIKFAGKHGLPGNSWWRRFKKQYKIKLRRTSHRNRSAAFSLTREALNSFYDLLYEVVQEYKIPPELLWATDETGFMRTKARGYVAMPVGGATPKTVSDELALHITLQGIVNAVGEKLPLLLLLKGAGERLTKDPLEGLPPDSAVIFTRKGYTSCTEKLALVLQRKRGQMSSLFSFSSAGSLGIWIHDIRTCETKASTHYC